jgi:hypothetical protein
LCAQFRLPTNNINLTLGCEIFLVKTRRGVGGADASTSDRAHARNGKDKSQVDGMDEGAGARAACVGGMVVQVCARPVRGRCDDVHCLAGGSYLERINPFLLQESIGLRWRGLRLGEHKHRCARVAESRVCVHAPLVRGEVDSEWINLDVTGEERRQTKLTRVRTLGWGAMGQGVGG